MLKTIGSDMELFAKNALGEHIALCGMIGGSKEKPMPLKHIGNGFMIQEDNVACEFNIPVCENEDQFALYFGIMRTEIEKILAKLNLHISTEASVSFAQTQLTHPNALVFGCEPDYNAWSMEENKKPHAKDEKLRTAGGHIHVGTDIDMVRGVRLMDLFLGVPAILMDDSPSSVARRELYGKAGAMRPKPYGFEYRVLSNFWMFKEELTRWVYKQTALACGYYGEIKEKEGELITECINTGNKELAQKLVTKYGITLA